MGKKVRRIEEEREEVNISNIKKLVSTDRIANQRAKQRKKATHSTYMIRICSSKTITSNI